MATAVRGARLFDGERMVDVPVVVMDDARIVAVGREPPEGVSVVDLPDTTLLPGLIDCHQHLCFDGNGSLEEQVSGIDDDALEARAREAARRALRAGITTVRDLGDRNYLTLGLRDDPTLPTILAAGPPITITQGHCWYLGGECVDDKALLTAVAERADRGCDVVKVMVSGGALTPTFPAWESQFSTDQLRTVVEDAHRRGIRVAAHCHATGAIVSALDAGADSIEHCTFMEPGATSRPTEPLLARIAGSGVCVSATVGRLPGLPLPPLVAANIETIRTSRRRLHELGAFLVGGTDAGIDASKPHDVLPHAFADFQLAGMTTVDALRALTSRGARALGVEDRKGRLAIGYDADVVAVHGDPVTGSGDLCSVAGVWHGGAPVATA